VLVRVPSNMSEEEVVSTINKVASRLAHKFTFAFYELEDIQQEAFIIAMEAMNRYDEKKPLENFLFVHVANRLKNFKRDNYFRQDEGSAQKIQKRKKNLLEPASIESFNVSRDAGYEVLNEISNSEMKALVDKRLPAHLRADYLRLCSGVSLNKNRVYEIEQTIQEIIDNE